MKQQSSEISMRSKKQHIRLWFECLQICHSQSEYSDDLIQSSEFYNEWGNITHIKFDDWWKEKQYLFDDFTVREVSRVSNNPNVITLSIPLNEKVSVITNDVKRIVERRQTEKLIEFGIDPSNLKSKNLGNGKYTFTQKEIKGVFHYVNLEIYKIFLRLNKPPINRNFIIEIRKDFDSRKRSKLSKTILHIPQLEDLEKRFDKDALLNVIRSVRRGIKGVEKTLTNVSKGRFP